MAENVGDFSGDHNPIIQIDIDARNIGITRPVELGIVADVKLALQVLVHGFRARGARARDGRDLAR